MVCVTEGNQIFCVNDFKKPNPIKMADPGIEEYPICVAVIEPQYTMSGNVEVLLGVGDYVLGVEEEGVQQLGLGLGPIQKMAVSQNGKYLAMFTHDGRLLVVLTDFSRIIFEYTCEVCFMLLSFVELFVCGFYDDYCVTRSPDKQCY